MIIETYIETNSEYNDGCVLDEYRGNYSICSAQQGKDGKKYLKWIYMQTKDRTPSEKVLPLKVMLGSDRAQAIKTLEYFLKVLKGSKQGGFESEHQPPDNAQPEIDPEMPF